MLLYIYVSVVGYSSGEFLLFEKSTINYSVNYIQYFEALGYQMCTSECERQHDCNSLVYNHMTFDCFLYDIMCDNAIVQQSESSAFGCYNQKLSRYGNCQSLDTAIALSSNTVECIQTGCPPHSVRNAEIWKQELHPTVNWYSCKPGYLNSSSNNSVTCQPSGQWTHSDMRCYLPGVEEANPAEYGNCIKSPSFVSSWITMESQTNNAEKFIEHSCQADPIKVEVQVRSQESFPYSDYVFNGVSSGLRDDDFSHKKYGGVISMYNASHVRLSAPHWRNGYQTGSIIYSGGINWHGPFKRTEQTADVRVKVWCAEDFKTPTFESAWKPVSNSGPYFHEIAHNLGEEIQLVTVQIKLGASSWISEGLGSSSVMRMNHFGGVIYGYSNTSVRIWLPKNKPIFNTFDGWGIPDANDKIFTYGKLKVRLWKKSDLGYTVERLNIGEANIINTTSLPEPVNLDKDFLYVSTYVDSGNNQGYSFPADSSIQESDKGTTFGSVVYAHSASELHIWQPIYDGDETGYLVYIDDHWGMSSYEQYSYSGILQASIVKAVDQC